MEPMMNKPYLTESDVRGAVEGALEATGTGDGSNERKILNYKWLTKALNDLIGEALVISKTRLDEAMNWHQYGTGHDDDSWCCKREQELRDEVMALEMAVPCSNEEKDETPYLR